MNSYRHILCYVLLVFSCMTSIFCFADGISEGNIFANELFGDFSNIANESSNQNKIGLPNFTDNPKEAGMKDGDIDNAKQEAFNNPNNEAVKAVKESNETKGDNDYSFTEEKWFLDSEDVSSSPQKTINADCKKLKIGDGTKIEKYKVKIEDYKTTEEFKYCEEPKKAKYHCSRELSLKCKSTKECNNGGIVADSVDSDMQFSLNYPYLVIGTVADDYWHGSCQTYDRNTTFNMKNVKDLDEFRIVQAGFDDYFLIRVNGHVVYVGPDGGNKIQAEWEEKSGYIFGRRGRHVVNNGYGKRSCERGISRNIQLNIDLIPFLKEGKNEIFTRTIVAGDGEGWIKIKLKQHCCNDWEETWADGCEEVRK